MSNAKSDLIAKEVGRFALRLPTALYERLSRRAKVNERSMNSEIVEILMEVVEHENDQEVAELERQIDRIEQHLAGVRDSEEQLTKRLMLMRAELEDRRRVAGKTAQSD